MALVHAPSPAAAASGLHRAQLVEQRMRRLCTGLDHPGTVFALALEGHLAAGGQRARSRVSLTSSQRLGLAESDAVALAATVELLHNASLIQDDLQDRAQVRRGSATVWSKYGPDCAIGLTDLAISAAFRSLADVSEPRRIPGLIDWVHRAITTTLRGQTEDLSGRITDLDGAIALARRKSGPLFGLALGLPLYFADQQEALGTASEAAESFGVGYQIYDDLVDLDEDRACHSCSNLVIALEKTLPAEAARAETRRLAEHYLGAATAAAISLPECSGQGLVDRSEEVGHRLNLLSNA